jgi:acetyltransferase-like isoleucine patch superfamily enzyme
MRSPEAAAQLDAQRQAVRAWLAGPRDRPIVLEHGDDYCIDDVIAPSVCAKARFVARYAVLAAAAHVPFCRVKIALYRLVGMRIGSDVCISPGVIMDPLFPELIELEDGCCLGIGCRLLTHEYTATNFRLGPVRIGKGSVVGVFSTVRCGTTVGARVTVGANSFVNRDVPEGLVVGGVPARPLRNRQEGD